MGQHTWFEKDINIRHKINKLYEQLDQHEEGEIYLDKMEILQIDEEISNLEQQNETGYHDLFRTDKRSPDGAYIEEELTSLKQTLEWIENPENKVSFGHSVRDTEEQIKTYREEAIKEIHRFWDENPNGIITFG